MIFNIFINVFKLNIIFFGFLIINLWFVVKYGLYFVLFNIIIFVLLFGGGDIFIWLGNVVLFIFIIFVFFMIFIIFFLFKFFNWFFGWIFLCNFFLKLFLIIIYWVEFFGILCCLIVIILFDIEEWMLYEIKFCCLFIFCLNFILLLILIIGLVGVFICCWRGM